MEDNNDAVYLLNDNALDDDATNITATIANLQLLWERMMM